MLKEVVSSLLTQEGALIEPVGEDTIEALMPDDLQDRLSIPEICRLHFGPQPPEGALAINLESDLMEKFEGLLSEKGRLLIYPYRAERPIGPHVNPEKLVTQIAGFDNATFRLLDAEKSKTIYTLLTFKLTAISDEKRDDILYLCINESNGALNDDVIVPAISYLKEAKFKDEIIDNHANIDTLESKDMYGFIEKALNRKINENISPFLSNMKRRMDKDIGRLHTYYSGLQNEVIKKVFDKLARGEGKFDREKARVASISREYSSKISDLQRKYAVTAEIELIQVLKISADVYRINLKAMRKKNVRNFHLDWDPLSRRLDPVICENCYSSPESVMLCDDKLHFICKECDSSHTSSAKIICPICNNI